MNKVKFFIVLLLPIFTSVFAQNNIGIDFFGIKDYELSKKYFLQHLSANPAEANYYLGEIAFAEGNYEAAVNYYNQGLTNPKFDPYCKIGLAKTKIKTGDRTGGVADLIAVQRRFSKEIDILVPIGYAYLENQIIPEVQTLLREMQKIEKSNPKIYVLEGDMLRTQQKHGEAGGKYDMAIYFDSKHAPAYLKVAEVYERINWQVAVEKLKELLAIYPDFKIPYRYLGKIYYTNGRYQLAVDAYKEFFAGGYYTVEDITRYVMALYVVKDYDEAYRIIKEGLDMAPNHFVLNRLQMYLAAATQNIEAGLKYAEFFFPLQKTQKEYDFIAMDYTIYATLLKDAKMYEEAIEQYKNALKIDSTDVGLYKEMATLANQRQQSGRAADYYQKFVKKSNPDKVELMDYLTMGRYYYSASILRSTNDTLNLLNRYQDMDFIIAISEDDIQRDSVINNQAYYIKMALQYYMKQADAAFDEVIALIPEGYTGYLWKGRIQSLMDPDTELGLAKPYYEKIIELLEEREEKSKMVFDALKEAYRYLGFYFYQLNDKPNIILYWNKVLEIDPEDQGAKDVLKSIKK